MPSISIDLLDLRDLLTRFDQTAKLQAAQSYEARQIYYSLDASLPSVIVPASLGKQLNALDPEGLIFHIQLKTLPADSLDNWTPSPDYAVVWSRADWLRSAEYRLSKSAHWQAARAQHEALRADDMRKSRMIDRIFTKIPPAAGRHLKEIIYTFTDEHKLKDFIAHFETALSITIYETPEGSPGTGQVVQEAQPSTEEASPQVFIPAAAEERSALQAGTAGGQDE